MSIDDLPVRIGTRGSPLALWQAETVRAALIETTAGRIDPARFEIVVISTTGDQVRDRPLTEIGGKGLFVKEIEEALFDGRIDLAVHSLKDVPTWMPPGLAITAVMPGADPRDLLICPDLDKSAADPLASLPEGAVVGTASPRRQAQLLHRRPDLKVVSLRGNVGTRLAKLAEGGMQATILAVAGVERLGLVVPDSVAIDPAIMLPAVAQGVVGIEIRVDDGRIGPLVAALDDAATHRRIATERAMLGVLDGSCRTPIGGLATLTDDIIRLDALVALPDGSRLERLSESGTDPIAVGLAAGEALLARMGRALPRDDGGRHEGRVGFHR